MKNLLLPFITIVQLISTSFAGEVFYVSTTGNDNNDGKSWATAFADVQKGIDEAAALAGDDNPSQVWIAAGTYKHGTSMIMKNNVEIYGGFAGTETSLKERNNSNETILSGDNSYRVFYNFYTEKSPLYNSAKLDSITITEGCSKTGGHPSYADGGGVYNYYASPIITNCKFIKNATYDINNNNSSDSGGAIFNYTSTSNPIIKNCIFEYNKAAFGGAICGNSEISNCIFKLNNARNGGAIYNVKNIINCTFISNTASMSSSQGEGRGGAVYIDISDAQIYNCTFLKNIASGGSSGWGGAIYIYQTTKINIINCTFTANEARNPYSTLHKGSAICTQDSTDINVINCIIWGNPGGAIMGYSGGGNLYATNVFNIINCINEYPVIDGNKNLITNDPILSTIGNYGGFVPTMPIGAGSSAIGTGVPVEGLITDARGITRSSNPTIGAYEYLYGQPTYEKWILDNNLQQETSSPNATPHNDGITNMEKFAFGLDASKATSYNSNTNFVHASDGTSASLQFPISIEAEGSIQVKALMSTDLINWAETTATAIGTSTDGKFNLYKATSEIPQNGKVFLKLQVDEK